jgi:DNA helicase-2/ATP-dependent DNA helicase PcrA
MRYNEPSRFLQEVPLERLEEISGARSSFGSNRPGFMDRNTDNGNSNGSSGARVSGNFKKPDRAVSLGIDPKEFKPNAPTEIQAGMKVLHLKFGEGKVLSIDGGSANRIATIFFKNASDPQQRKIMLKFAKLQIIG